MAIKSPTARPYVRTQVSGKTILLLYDTGSDITCINAKSLLWINPKAKVERINSIKRNFQAAGGHALKVIGTTKLSCQIDNRTVEHKFFVIENLNEKGILGMDFISQHALSQDPRTNTFHWKGESRKHVWKHGKIFCAKDTKIGALSTNQVKIQIATEDGRAPDEGCQMIGQVSHEGQPLLYGNPCLIEANTAKLCTILVHNCSPIATELQSGEQIGFVENIQQEEKYLLDEALINSITVDRPMRKLEKKDQEFLRQNSKILVPEQYKKRYEKVLEQCHEVFSRDKSDLGKSDLLSHDITLKSNEPVYVKQFKIPDAHMKEVKQHLSEWLKLGVVEPCRSKYNSPIFVVPKKDGTLRVVQDFRALNAQTHVDKYSMHDVSECVNQIGRAGSTIFSTIDLTSGFWQMMLDKKSQEFTAFTIPGYGQMKWTVAPMGLLGSPASFQRLVEKALEGIPNVIVYIDDLIIHTNSHEDHVRILLRVFNRLFKHNLKINLKKCVFGSREVSYLGFRLTPEGIKPGIDKLKAVGQCKPPSTVKEVRQFLGLCNFFRSHVKNFAIISAPLANLTRKDVKWRRGELPPDALTSFRELQTILCSEPVMDYPRRNRPYCLITDASGGDEKHPGGLGAILTQIDEKNQHKVIAYASRKLATHEKNYTPFLLEMQASIWGMEHFFTYLKGRHFTLFTDHKPLEKLGAVHTKTLNRLQEMMNTYDFTIQYKKGSEMPADFLSRNVVNSISWNSLDLAQEQDKNVLIKSIKDFLLHRKLPESKEMWSSIKGLAMDCFVENDVVWKRIKRQGEPSRVVLFVPSSMKADIIREAHGHLLAGHDGLFKTKERIMQCYYWPCMDKDIADHLEQCRQCQVRKATNKAPQTELTPLPQCTEPNQRIHADLFGPLRTSGNNKKYILCMTDAFTKYVELVPLPNKEATTVAAAIFSRWICRFGSPLQITTDGGKEFTADLTNELFKQMQITHLTTSPYHPQCNSQAEVVNKTIAKYLASFVNDSTLDWELYLAPMMFTYNTSIHKSIRNTPYFLTFGVEPRTPVFPAADLRRKFYGESDVDELQHRLHLARHIATENNEQARQQYENQYNKKVKPINFYKGQLVLLNEFNTLHKNRKLAPKYSGPHIVSKLIHDTNVELKLQNGRKTIVHINRIKPYSQNLSMPINNNVHDENDETQHFNPLEMFHHETSHNIQVDPPEGRKRGRPPKIKFQNTGRDAAPTERETLSQTQPHRDQNFQIDLEEFNRCAEGLQKHLPEINNNNDARRITRSMIAQQGSVTNINPISKQQQTVKKIKRKKNVSKYFTSEQERNFNKTGDIFGYTLRINEEPRAQPLAVDNDTDSSSGSYEYVTDSEASDSTDEELPANDGQEEPQNGNNEEQLPVAHQPEPETQPGMVLPLLPAQLPNILPVGPGLPTTENKPRTSAPTTERTTTPTGPGRQDSQTLPTMPKSSTTPTEKKDEPKSPVSQLPSTRRMSPRIQARTSEMAPPSALLTRRIIAKKSDDQRQPDDQISTTSNPTETGTRPKIKGPIPKTSVQESPPDQSKDSSKMSEAENSSLSSTNPMGQKPIDVSGLKYVLMAHISNRNNQASRAQSQASARELYDFLVKSPSPIGIDQIISLTGITPDKVVTEIIEAAYHQNDSSYNLSLRQLEESSLADKARPSDLTRPLRSNTKAPDIPPTPPFSLEHQLKLLEEKYKQKQKK